MDQNSRIVKRIIFIGLLAALLPSSSSAETLLTEPEALKIVFPKSQSIEIQVRTLTESQGEDLQKKTKGDTRDVAVMDYRETRGWEVKEQRFLRQFRGKSLADPITVDRDIVNYTGATLSSHAIAHGVKKALALIQTFYLQPAANNRP